MSTNNAPTRTPPVVQRLRTVTEVRIRCDGSKDGRKIGTIDANALHVDWAKLSLVEALDLAQAIIEWADTFAIADHGDLRDARVAMHNINNAFDPF